jgi:hypothetical protein
MRLITTQGRAMGDFNDAGDRDARHLSLHSPPSDARLEIQISDLLAGDVLLYRPRSPNPFQLAISAMTNSAYTHAAIYVGDGLIADSTVPWGVTQHDVTGSLKGSLCVGVLRTQLGFGSQRVEELLKFAEAVAGKRRFYNAISALTLPKRIKKLFGDQLDFVRDNYGRATPTEEFAKQRFFCSAFVVACWTVVGIIDPTAQVAYEPINFSPGGLLVDFH